ncbi:MAG: O-antigen ligase family protein [Gemmataceae bacterium]
MSESAPVIGPATPQMSRLGFWLTLLCVTLLGYALAGKGFAYIGMPPLFIGEVALLCGLVPFIIDGCWYQTLRTPCIWFLGLLGVWGAMRTIPYVSSQGFDALRDAALWAYGAFAVLVLSHLRAHPKRLASLVHAYRFLPPLLLCVVPIVWVVTRVFPRAEVPRWPWADVQIIESKGGDILVHCAGILCYWVSGLGGRVRPIWLIPLAGTVVLVGTYDRAGLLSFLVVFAYCMFLKPRNQLLWRQILMGLAAVFLLAVTNIQIQMPGREREISFRQLMSNVTSTVSSSAAGDLDATKEWRLNWWTDVIDYTFHGPYFWQGKGFGANLADEDHYQVEEDNSLRNPHNGHLAMLARAGVPGLALWLLVQLSWAFTILGGFVASYRLKQLRWQQLFMCLMGYWLAFMINASFDVYLEGPMGGIWYWTVYGFGLAAVAIRRSHPEVLDVLDAKPVEGGP